MSDGITVPLESKVVDWLVSLIQSDALLQGIGNQEEVDTVLRSASQPDFVRSFSIDYVSRLAAAKASDYVLEQLRQLEIIAVNKSISLTAGEILRPDIICFNPESRVVVVFEVKRDENTERQTVTELVAYEQKVRNLLPFSGPFEVCFVVVAREWTTLLTHAVGALSAWSHKQVLALRLNIEEPSFSLDCVLAAAWHQLGSVWIPRQALQTIDIVLVEEDIDWEERIPPLVWTAFAAIVRAAERAGSHGFAMLSDDVGGPSRARWIITLCAIDPLAMYQWMRQQHLTQRQSETIEFLDRRAKDESPRIPAIIFRMAQEAFSTLEERYGPELDGTLSWDEKVAILRLRARPKYFEFWGLLGDYAREFVLSPSVRENYMSHLSHGALDWTHPIVAVPLVDLLSKPIPFLNGLITCTDAFDVGVVLGNLEQAVRNADSGAEDAEQYEPWVAWAEIEAVRWCVEMKQLYQNAQEITTPLPTLSSNKDKRLGSVRDISQWALDWLIGDEHPIHQALFNLGRSGTLRFSGWTKTQLSVAATASLVAQARSAFDALLSYAVSAQDVFGRAAWVKLRTRFAPFLLWNDGGVDVQSARNIPDALLLDCFIDTILPAANETVSVVLHTVGPISSVQVDWAHAKNMARASFDAEYKWHTIILAQNGAIGAVKLDDWMTAHLTPIRDPEREVYFVNENARATIARKMTWNELMAPGFLENQSKLPAARTQHPAAPEGK